MGFFMSLAKALIPKPTRAPRQPRQLTDRDRAIVLMSANSIVRVINESLRIAATTFNATTKASRLGVVHKKLEMLAKLRAKYPFIPVEGMSAFSLDLARIERAELPVKPTKRAAPKRREKATVVKI